MENFIVSARKYRPTTFDSVVGQMAITTTLKNAIRNNHLAQAYLFCGPRGVGKTTCARIFAKTINCLSVKSNIEPCNECESCKAFNEARSYNVHELDAASNNSVDDIRTLIDKVRIPPPIGRYSVYVIDEVHMLSQAAFNAFLKTLEEPPRHAIFILATTEKHKILPTILSRCQIFDFNRIQIKDIVEYLAKISQNEGNEYDVDGLNIIAQKADGALRDALSIYDQIVSFSDGKVTYENVIKSLNVLDYQYYFRLTDSFLNENIENAFLVLDELIARGINLQSFVEGLSKHFRDLLIAKNKNLIQLLEVGENIKNKYIHQAAEAPIDFIYDCLEITTDCELHLKERKNQRLFLEVTFVKLCRIVSKKKTLVENRTATVSTIDTLEKSTPSVSQSIKEVGTTTSKSGANTTASASASSSSYKNNISTPSIKEVLQGINQTPTNSAEKKNNLIKEEVENVKQRNEAFSHEQLVNVYQQFVETLRENPRFYLALRNGFQLIDDYTIEIIFSNQITHDDFLQNLMGKLLTFLRNELKNDNIVITTKINESNEQNLPFTSDEKYKYLADLNKNVIKLRQQLNLDFE